MGSTTTHPLFDTPLPLGWKLLLTDDIKSPEKSSCVAGPFGSDISSKFFVESGVPIIRGGNLRNDLTRFAPSGFAFVSEEQAMKYKAQHVRAGDLVFTCWGTLGQVGLIPKTGPFSEYIISNKQLKLRPNSDIADSEYLFYYFAGPKMVQHVLGKAIGAAVPGINLGILKELPVVLPPLATQQRIAGILSVYDEMIENSQQRIKTLESMARALYREWFVYCRFPGHESVTFVPSILGEIPHGWEVKTVREVAALVSRGPSLTYVDSGGVQVVNQRCVRNEGIEMQAVQYAAPLPAKKSHLYLQPRDILINSMGVGTLGRVSRNLSINKPTIIHNCITVVRSKASETTQSFLYYRLSECQEQFESLGIGATGQTSLRIETIEDVQFALPSVTLLEAFENLVSPMWTQVGVLKHQIESLRAARDLLLPRLLSGRIEVEAIAS
jgi:type I restriction enzyme S subunit